MGHYIIGRYLAAGLCFPPSTYSTQKVQDIEQITHYFGVIYSN